MIFYVCQTTTMTAFRYFDQNLISMTIIIRDNDDYGSLLKLITICDVL